MNLAIMKTSISDLPRSESQGNEFLMLRKKAREVRIEGDERLIPFERFMSGEVIGHKKLIRNYSAGNKQKIGIISAMLHYPQLLILDEPFNFLDPSSQSIIKHLLKKYNEEHQATVIISSHNLNHTVDVCPRIALLEHGVIIRDIINEDNSAEKELEDYFNVEEE